MAKKDFLYDKIDRWVEEGAISSEQAEILKRQEENSTITPARAPRVNIDEILVYIGSLVVFLALAFLVGLNWAELGSAGRVMSILIPTVILLVLGDYLRRSARNRFKRGAQALWIGGSLLSGLLFGVTCYELNIITDTPILVLSSCIFATLVSGTAFVLLSGIPQSIAFHLCGSATMFTLVIWLEETYPPFNPWRNLIISLIFGLVFLILSEWHRNREEKNLMAVSRIFGSIIFLGASFSLAPYDFEASWQKTLMETISFVTSVTFIAASIKKQSQIFLYSGAGFLLMWVIYINFEHFAEKIGMPIALLIIGVLLIGLGLGTSRLSKEIRSPE